MKTTLLLLFLGVNLLGVSQSVKMQGKTPQLLNPALTGAYNTGQVNVLSSISLNSHPLNFGYVGFNTRIDKIKSGVGLHFRNFRDYYIINYYYDFYVPYPTYSAFGLSYAVQQNLGSKWTMSIGGEADINQRIENWDEVKEQNKFCNDCPTGKITDIYYDYIAGMMFYTKKTYIDVSVRHFANFYQPLEIKLGTGHTFNFNDTTNTKLLTVGVNLSTIGLYLDFNVKALFKYKSFYIGVATGMFRSFGYNLQLGYAYKQFRFNYNLSKDLSNPFITNEISLQVKLPKTFNRQSKAFGHLLY